MRIERWDRITKWTIYALCGLTVIALGRQIERKCQSVKQASETQKPLKWTLAFQEEFNETTLDSSKWTPSTGTFIMRENPEQYFIPEAVSVQNGYLRIRSQRQDYKGYHYTSGEVRTQHKFSLLYGRVVVRCRFPQGNGCWAASYLLPDNDQWPPEIDIAEHIGRDPETMYFTNHWTDDIGEYQEISSDFVSTTTDWAKWHEYAVEWEPKAIRWYVDGILCAQATNGISDTPMYLRINTAIGGSFSGEPSEDMEPQFYDVDYVRIYQSQGIKAPANSPFRPVFAWFVHNNFNAWWEVGTLLLLSFLPLPFAWWLRVRRTLLIAAVGMGTFHYMMWRFQAINWDCWWIAVPLLMVELYWILQLIGFLYTTWPRPEPEINPKEDPTQRPIFILIPTVNEGCVILERTIGGALAARQLYLAQYPHAQVKVIVCNDGYVANVTGWQETEALTMRLGVDCVTRKIGGGAKAGNIEYARQLSGATGEALLVIFDADMVAEPGFLLKTVPPLADPTIGWVQTGQYYSNLENPVARWAEDQQALFYQVICPGKAALNASFLCGTNFIIRGTLLDEIGGFPQDSITEDFAASILLHQRWRSLFLTEVLAQGLGPADLKSYFAQQQRWATGVFSVLRRHWRTIFLPTRSGLSLEQRIQYGLSCTHYLNGVCSFVFLIAPLFYLLMNESAIRMLDLSRSVGFLLPYLIASLAARWSISGHRIHWRGNIIGFGSFPVLIKSLWIVLMGKKSHFTVTAKLRQSAKPWKQLLPHSIAILLCLAGLLAGTIRGAKGWLLPTYWVMCMLIALGSMLYLGLIDRDRSECTRP